ncbi:hypothetical protein E143388_05642 [Rhodococcus opacus]|nr:hypothetical protein E143388_05642 [Rhodococcus opacus]
MPQYRRRRARRALPPEFAANGALIAKYDCVCYWCGEPILPGHPIRFLKRQPLHDGPCSIAMHDTASG